LLINKFNVPMNYGFAVAANACSMLAPQGSWLEQVKRAMSNSHLDRACSQRILEGEHFPASDRNPRFLALRFVEVRAQLIIASEGGAA
jgi:hypothetical protein